MGWRKSPGRLGLATARYLNPSCRRQCLIIKLGGMKSATFATSLAGVIGTVIVFALSFMLARLLVPRTVSPERTE